MASTCRHGESAGRLQAVNLAVQSYRTSPLALTISRISMIAWPREQFVAK